MRCDAMRCCMGRPFLPFSSSSSLSTAKASRRAGYCFHARRDILDSCKYKLLLLLLLLLLPVDISFGMLRDAPLRVIFVQDDDDDEF